RSCSACTLASPGWRPVETGTRPGSIAELPRLLRVSFLAIGVWLLALKTGMESPTLVRLAAELLVTSFTPCWSVVEKQVAHRHRFHPAPGARAIRTSRPNVVSQPMMR